MNRNYIIIKCLTPFNYEFLDQPNVPNISPIDFVISIQVESIPRSVKNELNLFTNYIFEINNSDKSVCGLLLNHLYLDKLLFNFEKNEINFYLNHEPNIYNHKIKMFRKNTDIRIDIIEAIKYFLNISPSDDISKITEIKPAHNSK